jgi:hypothetical protein
MWQSSEQEIGQKAEMALPLLGFDDGCLHGR